MSLKEKNKEYDLKYTEKLIKSSIRGIRNNYKGRLGEDVAINFLESKGYEVKLIDNIIATNAKLLSDE